MSQTSSRLYDALLEPLLRRWKSKLASWIVDEPGGLSLDICCGTGMQCRLLAKHVSVIGIDLDADMVKFARSRAPHIPYVCADAAQLPFKAESFQNTIISLALHDKPERLRDAMIGEANRSLRPSGRLWLIDFEYPHTMKEKIGYSLIFVIELMAGREHFSNGREFVTSGGLESYLHRQNLTPEKSYKSRWGSSSIVAAVRIIST